MCTLTGNHDLQFKQNQVWKHSQADQTPLPALQLNTLPHWGGCGSDIDLIQGTKNRQT